MKSVAIVAALIGERAAVCLHICDLLPLVRTHLHEFGLSVAS